MSQNSEEPLEEMSKLEARRAKVLVLREKVERYLAAEKGTVPQDAIDDATVAYLDAQYDWAAERDK